MRLCGYAEEPVAVDPVTAIYCPALSQVTAICRNTATRRPSPRSGGLETGLELGQLAVGGGDPLLLGAEVDQDGDFFLDTDDHAEAVPVMRYLVVEGVVLDVPDRRGDVVEGTSGERAPGGGAGSLHEIPV
jgi:hypothetical protein